VYKWITNNEHNDNIVFKLINVSKTLSGVLMDLTELLSASNNDFKPQSNEQRERVVKVQRIRDQNKIRPQMATTEASEQNGLEENQEKTNEQQTIATFDDSYAQHIADSDCTNYMVNDTMPIPDLDMFLKRPIILGTYNWASTATLGQQLQTWIFPDVLFTTTMMNKLEKMAFWRPDIEITIRMNGTPMHYGKLVFAWIPQAQQLNAAYTTSYFSMFSNRWLQVSASANQTVVLTVPFTHYKERCSVGFQLEDFFTLYCYVSAPLNSVNGAPPAINFTMYARVVNTGLSGYNYTTNWVAQSGRQKVGLGSIKSEAEIKSAQGNVVSSSITGLGDSVSKFNWIPVIGELASPIGTGIKVVGSILKWFGLNKPINVAHTLPMQIRQPRLLQIEDNPTSMMLAPNGSATVSKDYALVNDVLESASILKFIQRPALQYVGTITSSNVKGDIVYNSVASPVGGACYDYVTPLNYTGFVGTPLQFMSRFFNQWRGSIRVHLSFICSHFHSIRVRVYYIPYFISSATLPTITETQGIDVINTVIDITQETDYSFTIPYCQEAEWLDTIFTTGANFSRFNCNGTWGIQVINPLTSGAATVNPIYFQVFTSAAADFQFAQPNAGRTLDLGVFKPQSLSSTECEIPASSVACLESKEYPSIGGFSVGRTSHNVFQAVSVNSVKELTNMIQPTVSKQALSTTAPNLVTYVPMEDSKLSLTTSTLYCNAMYNMTTVFRYWRGSNQLVCRSRDPALNAFTNANINYSVASSATGQFGAVVAGADYNALTPALAAVSATSSACFITQDKNPLDVTVPWYFKYKCSLTKNHIVAAKFEGQTGMTYSINWYTTSANNNYLFCLGGGDDYILGWQLGIPLASVGAP